MTPQEGAAAYIRFYETMTLESLAQLETLVTQDVRFADPFNDVVGVAALRRILEKMFADLAVPRFVVTHRAWDGDTCLLRWHFTARGKTGGKTGGAAWSIEGMSELHFAPDGRVARHIDHWDAARQVYERLPLLGGALRFIRRRVAA